ncbi:hypothetical protein B4100_0892 [Heyndrickxia coagulans]|nr:hypothetical protein B4100_0892 [Heyndrickxia coagulans]
MISLLLDWLTGQKVGNTGWIAEIRKGIHLLQDGKDIV